MDSISLEKVKQYFKDISNIEYLDKGGQKTVLTGDHCEYGSIVLKLTNKLDERTK